MEWPFNDPAPVPAPRRRPEIQALRALAALSVLLYHLWPLVFPGFFVGIDVFFAISGFLITANILREVQRTDRVSLTGFWARRARRLLPASYLVLLAAAVATWAFAPRTHWQRNFSEIEASAAYVQNWKLAARPDYWWRDQIASPVLHYWTLSIEEQFYFVWPALIALAAWLTSRMRAVNRWRAIGAALAGLTAVSFVYGRFAYAADPQAAYFSAAARAWEFSAGGLLALLSDSRGRHDSIRAAVSWAGLLALAVAAFTGTANSYSGGAAALPVTGTLASIWAGDPDAAWGPAVILRSRPLQFLGDISYSLYLWHWFLIAMVPEVLRRPIGFGPRLAILAASVVLGWLTKVAVEDPVRHVGLRAPRWTLYAAALALSAFVAASDSVLDALRRQESRAADAAAAWSRKNPPCYGAWARDSRAGKCRNPELDGLVTPAPIVFRSDVSLPPLLWASGPLEVRRIGPPGRPAGTAFALVGDSHAQRMTYAFDALARRENWRGYLLTGCPLKLSGESPDPACPEWSARVFEWLKAHPEVRVVFSSALAEPDPLGLDREGFLSAWKALPSSVERVVVLRDNPRNPQRDCLERALEDGKNPALCREPRADSLVPDAAAEAARTAGRRVEVLDLTDIYCDADYCDQVIGGVRVYDDGSHLSPEFSRTLAPVLLRRIGQPRRDGKTAGYLTQIIGGPVGPAVR